MDQASVKSQDSPTNTPQAGLIHPLDYRKKLRIPHQSDQLSLITFNAGLLKYKTCGVTVYQNPPFTDRRLTHIPMALRSCDADVVALQEVFDEGHAEFLIENLRQVYPFVGRRTSGNCLSLHNGLMVLSKYPIKRTFFHAFKTVTYLERVFASKGMLEVCLEIPGIGAVTLFNIHMASGAVNPESENVEKVRAEEIEQLLTCCEQAIDRGEIPLIIGDLNAAPELNAANYRIFVDRGWRDVWLLSTERRCSNFGGSPYRSLDTNSEVLRTAPSIRHKELSEGHGAFGSSVSTTAANLNFVPSTTGNHPLKTSVREEMMTADTGVGEQKVYKRASLRDEEQGTSCVRRSSAESMKTMREDFDTDIQSATTQGFVDSEIREEGPRPAFISRSLHKATHGKNSDEETSETTGLKDESSSLLANKRQQVIVPPEDLELGLLGENDRTTAPVDIAGANKYNPFPNRADWLKGIDGRLRSNEYNVGDLFTKGTSGDESTTLPISSRQYNGFSKDEASRESLLGTRNLEQYEQEIEESQWRRQAYTWDPENPLNIIGPHATCHGLRCDYIFLPPASVSRRLSHFKPVVADIVFREPRVLVNGWCFGCFGRMMLVTLSDHYALRIVLKCFKNSQTNNSEHNSTPNSDIQLPEHQIQTGKTDKSALISEELKNKRT